MTFKRVIEESSRSKRTNIVVAIDQINYNRRDLIRKSIEILYKVHNHICAVKLSYHLVLPVGLDGAKKIIDAAHDLNLPVIMDCKINDIGYTNRVLAETFFDAGFDAVTANPFVGWEDGLEPVFEAARKTGCGVILLVFMSHKSSLDGYGQNVYVPDAGKLEPQYVLFAKRALEWGADGAVVGATFPEKIREIRSILRDEVPIYSPGIGFQGGDAQLAFSSGAKYIIVGRTVTLADKPEEILLYLKSQLNANLV
ncbi:MAG: orotidine 5'-phosphate decarboxylase [Nitrososphaerota archaeon]|nr:orotidine 5'-phosphate decarboxylase [Candidatus Bathyarchaeota archaeon]MDW8049020.1 orotidine 5'-phosphate decarboxylase [Nitrososphaerota archaeon]